jgi:hypothetical protein
MPRQYPAGSLEAWLIGQQDAPDPHRDLRERPKHGQSLRWPSLVERYLEGEFWAYVVTRIRVPAFGEGEALYLVTVFEGAIGSVSASERLPELNMAGRSRDPIHAKKRRATPYRDHAMLVAYREGIENPEEVAPPVIPSAVRLYALYGVSISVAEITDLLRRSINETSVFMPSDTVLQVDRKLGGLPRLRGFTEIEDGELPSEIVQAAVQVVDNLPDVGTPSRRGGFVNLKYQLVTLCPLVELEGMSIWVSTEEPTNIAIEPLKLLLGTPKLQRRIVERV